MVNIGFYSKTIFQKKIKPLFIKAILCCLPFFASSQGVLLQTIDQLNSRVARGGDTTYVINFWASWCVPCLKELPYFDAINEKYKTEKLKVLLVSVDFKSELHAGVLAALKRKKIRSEVWLLDEKSGPEFIDRINKNWSGAIPATLFIKGKERLFFEKEFTFPELEKQYKAMQ